MNSENESFSQKPLIGSRLSSELYQSFVNYLVNESKRMPSKHLLVREMMQTMNFRAKKTNNTIRKKFRNWTKRMALSDGLLIHKPTKKIIIPEMEFFRIIKEIHESSPQHLNVTQTVRQIKSRFTWSSKNFGMNLTDVFTALSQCQHKKCQKSVKIIKNRLKSDSLNPKPNIFGDNCHSSGINEDRSEVGAQNGSTDNQTDESIGFGSLTQTEVGSKLFNELVFKIHLMRIHINLFKVHKLRRNLPLRQSIQRCEELIQQIRRTYTK